MALVETPQPLYPPKPEILARLGRVIAAQTEFFDVSGGVNRLSAALTCFEFDCDGKPRSGCGFSAHIEREPICWFHARERDN